MNFGALQFQGFNYFQDGRYSMLSRHIIPKNVHKKKGA